MTNKEAIKRLTAIVRCTERTASGIDEDCNCERCDNCSLLYEQGNIGERIEAMKTAISALEKQIPKKSKVSMNTWVCPVCGRDVEYQVMIGENILFGGQNDYCPKCGQRIDWEEGEQDE